MSKRIPQAGDIWLNPRTLHHWMIVDIAHDQWSGKDYAICRNLNIDESTLWDYADQNYDFPLYAIKNFWRYKG